MSYWVTLKDAETRRNLLTDHHAEGGTYAIGGTGQCELNVTYNYGGAHTHLAEDGLRWLDGKRAFRTRNRLEIAVKFLGTERDDDYWKPTNGNAGYALSILLKWAKEHPQGVWQVH